MWKTRTVQGAVITAAIAGAFTASTMSASADIIRSGSDVYAWGCHGYIVKDAPNNYYAVETSGNCLLSIDWTDGPTWEKAAGWTTLNTGSEGSVYARGTDYITVCLVPKSNPGIHEVCGPLIHGG